MLMRLQNDSTKNVCVICQFSLFAPLPSTKKVKKINWLPQQRPLSNQKTNIRLVIHTHMSINSENMDKISPV